MVVCESQCFYKCAHFSTGTVVPVGRGEGGGLITHIFIDLVNERSNNWNNLLAVQQQQKKTCLTSCVCTILMDLNRTTVPLEPVLSSM